MNINLSCPINTLSYGIVSFNILKELCSQGHKVSWTPIGDTEAEPKYHKFLEERATALYDDSAPSVRIFHQFALSQHVGHGTKFGFPIFELTKFNETELYHLQHQDVVLTPSLWGKATLEDNGIKNVVCVPFGVDTSVFRPQEQERKTATTVFLNIGKFEVRKGHYELLEIFNSAFSEADDVLLVMSPMNLCFPNQQVAQEYNSEWVKMYMDSKMGKAGKIRFVDRLPNQEAVASLINSVDVGVFPTKAEGWCMPALEMLACAKPIIITNYSGQTEFVDENNAFLVEVGDFEEAYDGKFFLGGQGDWAVVEDNQKEAFTIYMRNLHEQKQREGKLFNQNGVDTANRFSWEHTVQKLVGAIS